MFSAGLPTKHNSASSLLGCLTEKCLGTILPVTTTLTNAGKKALTTLEKLFKMKDFGNLGTEPGNLGEPGDRRDVPSLYVKCPPASLPRNPLKTRTNLRRQVCRSFRASGA